MPDNDVAFRSNPAIVFVSITNDPSPTATVSFRANPAIVFTSSVVAPAVSHATAFRSNPAIVFSSTATGLRGGGSIRWQYSSTQIDHLAHKGAATGLRVNTVGGRNGTGSGVLRLTAAGKLSWRAPGSDTFGQAVNAATGGTYTLLDGDDADKWIEVTATAGELPTADTEIQVILRDRFANTFPRNDVTSSEAANGMISGRNFVLNNESAVQISNVTCWLTADASDGTEISWDNSNWYAPVNEAEAIATLGQEDIAGSGTRTLYTRWGGGSGLASNPRVRVRIHASFDDGDGGRARSEARGLFRIFNAAEYRFYRKQNEVPVVGVDSVWDTNSSLPHTPTDTFADGTWYVGCTYFDGVLESGFLDTPRFGVSGGSQTENPPTSAYHEELVVLSAGVIQIRAHYWKFPDGDDAADTWAIYYTTDGSTPTGAGAPDLTQTMAFAFGDGGLDVLQYSLPAQGNGTVVKALLKTQRAGAGEDPPVRSEAGDVMTATASTAGPAAPPALNAFAGHVGVK